METLLSYLIQTETIVPFKASSVALYADEVPIRFVSRVPLLPFTQALSWLSMRERIENNLFISRAVKEGQLFL